MKLDYEKLFQTYGIPFRTSGDEHCTEGWMSTFCPFCSPDKYHMGINLASGKFNCWACGSHSITQALCAILKLSTFELQKVILRFPADPAKREAYSRTSLSLEKECLLPAGSGALNKKHKEYLRSRHFNPVLLEDLYNVCGTPHYASIGSRIVMPIYWQDRIISWTARAIVEEGPRYLKCPKAKESFPAKQVLYGWEYIVKKCVVVEGIFDAWRLGPGAVATMGLGFSPEQVSLLSALDQVFILFDSDKPAIKRTHDMARRLSALVDVEILQIEASDPAELSKKEAKEIMGELGFYEKGATNANCGRSVGRM